MRSSSITSITLARTVPADYRVTYWNDGVARFDGLTGARQGAWTAASDVSWFTRCAKLARIVEPGVKGPTDDVATLVVETADERFVYEASYANEPGPFWTLSTIIDGMVQRTRWVPIDVLAEQDFSTWAQGIPVWWSVGPVAAAGLATATGVLVIAGSCASSATADALHQSYKDQRSALLEDGGLVQDGDRLRLFRHVAFSAPSAAASVLLGSNTNGRRVWRDRNGLSWAELDLEN